MMTREQIIFGLLLGMSSFSSASAQTPGSAFAFLNSIGINIHIDQGVPYQNYIPMLQYTGIKQFRTGGFPIASVIALCQITGAKADVTGIGGFQEIIRAAMRIAEAGCLTAVEGTNEPNNFPFHYPSPAGPLTGGSNSWMGVAQGTAQMYEWVKAGTCGKADCGEAVPALQGTPVFGTSESGAETDNVGLQYMTIPAPAPADVLMPAGTRYSDYMNAHNYVANNCHTLTDNQAWNASDPERNIPCFDGAYGEWGVTWNKKFQGYPPSQMASIPRVTTETGWGTCGNGSLSEVKQAAILLDTYFDQFARGWSFTYWYEMRDNEGGDTSCEGIYNADGTPKLAAVALHNLTAMLADPHPGTSAAADLSYTIPAEATVPTVHDMLLTKSDGSLWVAVWDERAAGSDQVTVNFAAPHATIEVYDPMIAGMTVPAPVQTLSNANTVSLTLSDHPVLISVVQ